MSQPRFCPSCGIKGPSATHLGRCVPPLESPAAWGAMTRPPLPPVAPGTSELVARLLEPQPPPVGDGPSVTDVALGLVEDERVRALLQARREQGVARYGTELRAFNGRDVRSDLVQELVDALAYAAQYETETGRDYCASMIEEVLVSLLDEHLPSELPSMPVPSRRVPVSKVTHSVRPPIVLGDDDETADPLTGERPVLPSELPSMPVRGGT